MRCVTAWRRLKARKQLRYRPFHLSYLSRSFIGARCPLCLPNPGTCMHTPRVHMRSSGMWKRHMCGPCAPQGFASRVGHATAAGSQAGHVGVIDKRARVRKKGQGEHRRSPTPFRRVEEQRRARAVKSVTPRRGICWWVVVPTVQETPNPAHHGSGEC